MSDETEVKIGESVGPQEIYKPYAETTIEWLQRWDNKQSVWSLEMGGLGPGYEQCIQILVAEILRDYIDVSIPNDFDGFGDAAIKRCNETVNGFSGAQVGAARWLALQYLKIGPETLEVLVLAYKAKSEELLDKALE